MISFEELKDTLREYLDRMDYYSDKGNFEKADDYKDEIISLVRMLTIQV